MSLQRPHRWVCECVGLAACFQTVVDLFDRRRRELSESDYSSGLEQRGDLGPDPADEGQVVWFVNRGGFRFIRAGRLRVCEGEVSARPVPGFSIGVRAVSASGSLCSASASAETASIGSGAPAAAAEDARLP